MSKASQVEKKEREIKFKTKEDISFDVASLINEILPLLVLLELPKPNAELSTGNDDDVTDNPMAAFQFTKRIKEGYFEKIEGKNEPFDIRPGLLYNLLNDMANEKNALKLLKKDDHGSEYRINGEGLRFLKEQVDRLDTFIRCYQEKRNKVFPVSNS